jgi:hypothetical protein
MVQKKSYLRYVNRDTLWQEDFPELAQASFSSAGASPELVQA